ncbi:hypothetical protein G7Y89_g6790 [Cudoniella acicularis]|uniref:Uncharacterized protein n=1 Tax=Cudoniella acicularis TaxID=354080 RepID=A0A8H4RMC3_9HELO|nr:hypothetical protein G7Y89_g6790 [Cudoniella acicularis]
MEDLFLWKDKWKVNGLLIKEVKDVVHEKQIEKWTSAGFRVITLSTIIVLECGILRYEWASSFEEWPFSSLTVMVLEYVDLFRVFNSAAGHSRVKDCERARVAAACGLDDARTIDLLREWAQSSRMMGSPCTEKLLVLVKINVFRALISNSLTLGIPSEAIMDDDAISTFCSPSRAVGQILALPSALRPTDLQISVPHHPWIDCLPVPRMRQNLIRAGDTFDVMELCGDLVGLFSTGTGRTGIIVWGEPWDAAGWEVTKGFLKNWGGSIEGCWEIFESTNRWRARRGEIALCFDKFIT